ncbi:hypothetical protein ACHAXR_013028 [Thalassiosira sp. AJA248-18]
MGKAEDFVQSFARPILNFLFEAIPFVISAAQASYKFYKKLPIEYVQFLIGAIMCFFGGIYPTVFAALQAAQHGGLATVSKALKALSEEIMVIIEESKKDDKVDKDGDGVADANQINGRELVKRKVKIVLTKMNPEKVNNAIASIYKVWMSVLAVLTIEFARTIALALTICNFIKKFADRSLLPIVKGATPQEYQKWCPVLLDWFCKSVGISIAWKIQTIISAFTSALAGGLIMSRTMMFIVSKGEKDHQDTYADEIASYVFAGLGFYFQYNMSFSAPFPLNIVLFPVGVAEQYIRWAVTKE